MVHRCAVCAQEAKNPLPDGWYQLKLHELSWDRTRLLRGSWVLCPECGARYPETLELIRSG